MGNSRGLDGLHTLSQVCGHVTVNIVDNRSPTGSIRRLLTKFRREVRNRAVAPGVRTKAARPGPSGQWPRRAARPAGYARRATAPGSRRSCARDRAAPEPRTSHGEGSTGVDTDRPLIPSADGCATTHGPVSAGPVAPHLQVTRPLRANPAWTNTVSRTLVCLVTQ